MSQLNIIRQGKTIANSFLKKDDLAKCCKMNLLLLVLGLMNGT